MATTYTDEHGEVLPKEEVKRAKGRAALHIALLINTGYSLADARWIAWREGDDGLDARLGKPRLPLKGGTT